MMESLLTVIQEVALRVSTWSPVGATMTTTVMIPVTISRKVALSTESFFSRKVLRRGLCPSLEIIKVRRRISPQFLKTRPLIEYTVSIATYPYKCLTLLRTTGWLVSRFEYRRTPFVRLSAESGALSAAQVRFKPSKEAFICGHISLTTGGVSVTVARPRPAPGHI